jgi:methyl-accepting chemotaxis protein PixJ
MTATYPSQKRNGAPESSGSPESIRQIADSALMLRTQLEGDNAVATETVLKTLKRIEGLASTLSVSAIQEAAQNSGEAFKAERDRLFSLISNIRNSLSLEVVFKAAVEEIRELMQVDRAIIYKFDAEFNGLVVAESVLPGYTASLGMPIIDTCFRESKAAQYATNRIAATDDIYKAGLTPCHIGLLERFEVKANLVVPILQGGQVWGLFILHQCEHTRHWEEFEINLLYQIATQITVAIQQAESFATVQMKAKTERDQLFDVVNSIRKSLDLDTIFATAVNEVQTLLRVDRAIVYQFDTEFNGVVVAEAVVPGWTVSLGMPIIDTCFQETKAAQYANNRVAATDDIYKSTLTPCHIGLLERFQVKANLVVPILQGEKVWGLFILHQCSAPRHWEESEINLLFQIATQLTVAIQQAETLKQVQIKAKSERDQLLAIVSGIRQSLDLSVIFNSTVGGVRELLGADRAVIYQFDPEFNGLVVAESMLPGWSASLGVPITDTCFKESKAAQYATNRIAATDDIYNAGLTACHIQLLERFQVKANLVVPILLGEQVWGLLIVHQCTNTRHWEETEISLLFQIATQLSVALQQSDLVVQAQRQAEIEQAKLTQRDQLFAVIADIRRTLDIQTIYKAATSELRTLLNADRVAIYQFDENWGGSFIAESVASGWRDLVGTERARVDDTNLQSTQGGRYRNSEASIVDDIYETGFDACHIELLEQFQARAYIIVPVFKEQKLWGLLAAYQNSGPRFWDESEVDILYQIALQLSVALQQADLIVQAQRQSEAEQAKLTLRDQMFTIIADIRRSLDIETIYQAATRELRMLLNADRVAIYQFTEDWGGAFIAESVASGWRALVGTERATVNDTNLQESSGGRYKNSEASIVDDIYTTGFSACHIELLEQFQARAYIIVPVFKEQKLWGLLAAYQNSGVREWQEFEVDVLYQVAQQLSVALQQSESLQQSQIQSQQLAESARQQQDAKELIQRRAMELLIEVDPVSRGDLTVRARVTDDELGTVADSYNQTIESLSNIVVQVQGAATQVTDISTDSGTSIQKLSNEALRQAEEIGNALDQIQKMTMSTQAVSLSARQAEEEVQQANRTVQSGDAAMNRTVEGILVIRDTVAATAKKIKRLSESSQKISKVVNLISNFAAQTNMLALNASIEAARAGEQGRGFAVVADEVRSLARQSATATAEIEKLVQEIQMETSEVSAAMESGTEQVVKGTQLVNETRQSLNEIAAVANRIKGMVESIAQASNVQTTEAQAATQIIERVAGMANQNSEDALQTLQSFQKLLETAQTLQTSVGQFKVE